MKINLDGVEIAWQHPLQVHEQSDGDVGEEVEAQKPLQVSLLCILSHFPTIYCFRSPTAEKFKNWQIK